MNTVLVMVLAEADPCHRSLMTDFFRQMPDIHVFFAADGLTALELVQTRAPDVLLADLFLPGMGGFQLARRCREAGMKGCILLQSFMDTPEVRSATAEVGADGFIQKPVNMTALLQDLEPLRYGLRGRYQDLLNQMDGGAAHLMGKEQTVLCAERLALKPKEMMKVLYLELAEEGRTAYQCVEKNIRKYIRYVHNYNTDFYRTHIGPGPDGKVRSNKNFLLALIETAKIPVKSEQ